MKRYTSEEKIEIIKEAQEPGQSVYSVCRRHGISKVSFYNWLNCYKRSKKNRLASLSSKIRRDNNHPRSLSYAQKIKILVFVHLHPEYSCHLIAKALGLSNHAVQNLLYKEGLNTSSARLEYSLKPFWKREDAERRLGMMELYNQGWKTGEICRHFKISKQTFNKWRKRFEAEKGEGSEVLADRYVRGSSHYRFISKEKEKEILDLVKVNPELSVHKLHLQLAGRVSHHGVQNVLSRYGLNTLDKRLEYVENVGQVPEVKTVPAYVPDIPLYKLRMLLAPFQSVPRLLVTNPSSGLLRLGFLSLPLLATFLFLRMLTTAAPGSSPVGLFFAAIALTFGLFFFIYSMKYYVTILMVLKLAQSGSAKQNQGQSQSENQSQSESEKSKVATFLSRFGIRLPQASQTGRVNPLLVNLEKIDLKEWPFVSIHVALYNE